MAQPTDQLVRELLETKISGLEEKMDIQNRNVMEMLSIIREQTTKTNGRVTKVEDDIKNLTSIENKHVVNCPRISDIEKINTKLEKMDEDALIVKIFNKYPKQLLTLVVALVIIALSTIGYTVYQVHTTIKEIQVENAALQKNHT